MTPSTSSRGPIALLALVAAVLLLPSPGQGQARGLSVTPYSGYRLGGSIVALKGDLQLEDAPFYGGQLDFRVRPEATASFSVDYQPTTLQLKNFGGFTEDLMDMGVWYFQVGGTAEVPSEARAVPFALGSFGMSWFKPEGEGGGRDSEYGLAGIFGGGVKIPLQSGRMGLRLQARVLLNSLWGDGSLWCGTGGCSVGVGGTLGPVQFDFGAGLTFGSQ